MVVFIARYHPSLIVFMTNKTPSGAEKQLKSTEPESSKMAKTSSFFFRQQASSIVCKLLAVVYTRKVTFFPEQCTTPSLFHNFEVSQGTHSHSLKTMVSSLEHHFLSLYVRMCT